MIECSEAVDQDRERPQRRVSQEGRHPDQPMDLDSRWVRGRPYPLSAHVSRSDRFCQHHCLLCSRGHCQPPPGDAPCAWRLSRPAWPPTGATWCESSVDFCNGIVSAAEIPFVFRILKGCFGFECTSISIVSNYCRQDSKVDFLLLNSGCPLQHHLFLYSDWWRDGTRQ